jgi:hypothetical protein
MTEIWGSEGGEDVDGGLLGYDIARTGQCLWTFRTDFGNQLQYYTASNATRLQSIFKKCRWGSVNIYNEQSLSAP